MRFNRFTLALAMLVTAAAFVPRPVFADGGFSVAPVRVDFSPDSRSASITVTNQDSVDRVMQIQILSWRQVDGKDVTEATSDVIASPPVFTLGPLMAQTIRVALVHRLPADKETSYRLIVSEVPSELKVAHFGAVTHLQFNLPVFIAPAEISMRKAEWSVAAAGPRELRLSLYNPTNVHVHLNTIGVVIPGQGMLVARGTRYALAGSRVSWMLKTQKPVAAGTQAKIVAETDDTHVTVPATVGAQ